MNSFHGKTKASILFRDSIVRNRLIEFCCCRFRYRDVDGEPLVDLDDDFGDDREPLEDFEDNLADDMGDWDGEGSQTPLYDNDKVKPRKRLVKKASSDKQTIDVPELIDEDVEDAVFDEYMEGRGGGTEYDDKVGRKRKNEKERSSSGGGKEKRYKLPSRGERKSEEIDEMWKSIAHNPEVHLFG